MSWDRYDRFKSIEFEKTMSQTTNYSSTEQHTYHRSLCLLVVVTFLIGGLTLPTIAQDQDSFTFFATADPQINIPKWGTAGTEKTIKQMNELPGMDFPFGGTVGEPRGVLVAGDLVDKMGNQNNWKRYKRFFDPKGDALLKYPVYAGTGNHDLTNEVSGGNLNWLEQEMVQRNKQRPGELNYGPKGFHYSWDWGPIHFINLNIFPGNKHRPVYGGTDPWNDPKDSLEFLKKDLEQNVRSKDQPIFLMWHYGLRGWGLDKWWTKKDLKNLAQVINGYNVILILHGHQHAYSKYKWNGYDVVMAPSPQKDRDPDNKDKESKPKGFLVFRVTDGELQMAVRRPDGWGRTWKTSLKGVVKKAQ
jgi:hypothetical protein